jgi:hypothetical protein
MPDITRNKFENKTKTCVIHLLGYTQHAVILSPNPHAPEPLQILTSQLKSQIRVKLLPIHQV